MEDLLFLPLGYLLQLTVWIQKGKNSLLISPRKRSCGKVMFSQACVILSAGGSAIPSPPLGLDLLLLAPRPLPPWEEHGTRQEVTSHPRPSIGTTKAGCTHPTGMLSCFVMR